MTYQLHIDIFNGYIHYYLDNTYIGMLVLEKGELSDFRAIIRKNRLDTTSKNLSKTIRTSLYTLLNHYLAERLFLDENTLNQKKEAIVKHNNHILLETANTINSNIEG